MIKLFALGFCSVFERDILVDNKDESLLLSTDFCELHVYIRAELQTVSLDLSSDAGKN